MDPSRNPDVNFIDLTLEDTETQASSSIASKKKRAYETEPVTPPSKKRWVGLRPKTPTTGASSSVGGLYTPPSTGPQNLMVLISSIKQTTHPRPSSTSPPRDHDAESNSEYNPSPSTLKHESDEEFGCPPRSPLSSESPTTAETIKDEGDDEDEEDEEDEEDDGDEEGEENEGKEEDEDDEEGERDRHTVPQELSLLGFRGYSNASFGLNSDVGFRAGAFLGLDQIPDCPRKNDQFYVDEATRHVEMDSSRPTPFISVTTNPIRAILRAFGAGTKSHQNPRLAILNLHVLRDAGVIQQAQDLGLKPNRKYSPRSEVLVWGAITRSAVISTIDVADLLHRPICNSQDSDVFEFRVMRRAWRAWFVRAVLQRKQTPLSPAAGFSVGQFIKAWKVSNIYHDVAISIILTDWSFNIESNESWKKHERFCMGVEEGLRHDLPELQEDIIMAESSSAHSNSAASTTIVGSHVELRAKAVPNPQSCEVSIFADLPLAYEIEREMDRNSHLESRQTGATSCLVTLEIKILLDIHEGL